MLKGLRKEPTAVRGALFSLPPVLSYFMTQEKARNKERTEISRTLCLDRTILKHENGWRRSWHVLSFRSLNTEALVFVAWVVGALS